MAPAAGAQEAATPEFKSRPAACPPVVATPYGFPVAATPLAMRAPAPTPSAGGLATGGKAVAMEAIEKLAEIARLGFGLMRGAAAEEDDTGALPHIMATPSWKHAFVRELEKGNDFSHAGVAAAAVAAPRISPKPRRAISASFSMASIATALPPVARPPAEGVGAGARMASGVAATGKPYGVATTGGQAAGLDLNSGVAASCAPAAGA